MPSVLHAVRARIEEFRALNGGAHPPGVAVTADEYMELLDTIDPMMPRGIAEQVNGLRVMGVPIHVQHGPYPWGNFPVREPSAATLKYIYAGRAIHTRR